MLESLHRRLDLVGTSLDRACYYIVAAIVATMSLVIMLQVGMRYLFNTGLSWPEEATTFLMAWMTFLGSAVAVKRLEHIQIDVFVSLLPGGAGRVVRLASKLVVLGLLLFLIIVGYGFVMGSVGYTSNTLGISLFWPRLSLVVGSSLMAYHMLVLVLGDVVEMRRS